MRKNVSVLMAVVIIAAFLAVSGCAKKNENGGSGGGAPNSAAGQKGGGRGKKGKIMTAKAEFKPITLKREYIGAVEPAFSVEIRSNTSGWLKSLPVDIGSKVSKGQTLCVVNQQDMQAQKEQSEAQNQQARAQGQAAEAQNQQARAGIAVAESAVARAEADLEQAKSDEARSETMFDKGFISKQDLENAKTTVKKFQAAVDAANAQLAQAKAQLAASNAQLSQSKAQLMQSQAQLKSVQIKLSDLTLRAPFSGVVAEKYVDAGAYVSPTVSIIKLVDDSSVKVVLNAIEEDISRITAGAPASVVSDAWPNRVFTGKVVRVSPVVESGSRTGAVEILIPNKTGELKAGMMARVSLVAARVPRALTVPADAVIIDQTTGDKYVMVMEGRKPGRHDVKVGIQAGEVVEITGGLSAGDTVVVGGLPTGAGAGGAEKGKKQGKGGKGG